MKKSILFVLVSMMSAVCIAQQRYENQFVVGSTGGYVPTSGYKASVFLEKYIGKTYSSIKLEGLYIGQSVATSHDSYKVDSKSYGAEFSYNYSLETVIPSPFYVNLSIGGIGAYQKVDYDDSYITIDASNKFIYGFTTSIQIEVIAYKSLSFFIEPKAYYFLNSDIRKVTGVLGGGLKVYL